MTAMKRLFGAALVCLVFFTQGAQAASGEQITRFDSKVTLTAEGVTQVTETIQYDFGSNARHGIYRVIPTELADDKKNLYRSSFALTGVAIDAAGIVPYTVTSGPNQTTIKIGDPNQTISGPHSYEISYSLTPLVRHGTGLDRFAYNVTGNGWDVAIQAVTVTVTPPQGLASTNQRCYTGRFGSTEQNCSQLAQAGSYSFATTKALSSGEGLSIEADFAENSFSSYLEPYKAPPINPIIYIAGALYGLVMLGVVGWPLYQRFKAWRAKKNQIVIAQYEAPDGLTPGQLGLLLDNKSNMTEITAMLIDLAVRGYIKIVQLSPKGIFSAAKYRFDRVAGNDDKLIDSEVLLLGALFRRKEGFAGLGNLFGSAAAKDTHEESAAGAKQSIELSEIDNDNMASAVKGIHRGLKKSLEHKGYYKTGAFPWKWMILFGLACLPLLAVLPLVGIALIVLGVLSAMSNKLTTAGLGEWAKVAGFKEFLSVTEAERLKFSDAPAKTPALFNALLPAAVALGVEKEWGKQFEGMDIANSTGWYSGQGAFTAMALTSDLGSGFSSAISSGFAPTQTSSSSGGGGFSGGGGGGGGGGSW